jgi:hypothetical protein
MNISVGVKTVKRYQQLFVSAVTFPLATQDRYDATKGSHSPFFKANSASGSSVLSVDA